jgi:hypothetical protein
MTRRRELAVSRDRQNATAEPRESEPIVARSIADRQLAKTTVKSGYGDKGDQKKR